MFLWSINPINMFMRTYKDFWLTKSKLATLYNWIRWQKYHQSIPISAWWWQVCNLHDSSKNIKLSPYGKAPVTWLNVGQNCCISMGGWNILGVGIAAISSWNDRHQKHNTILVSIFMEHNGNLNIAADALWYWYVVYPVCVNANPVPQKMYRIEVIVIQMWVNDANNLNTCQVVTFKYPRGDTWSSFSYKGISKINMVFQVSQYKEWLSPS